MASTVPSIFISSTCYDLRQIRADLRDFVESLGLRSILSEYNSFPVDPDVSAVENCLKAVDEGADIFVLVVGGRYGSTYDQSKSITNMEYLRARAKGIPIYGFVHQSILHILPVWKSNPDSNFQNVVDSTKLFEFVTYLREASGVWVFPFELAQDITDTLRKQFAYLFMDALRLRKQVTPLGLPKFLADLHGAPLRLVIEKPRLWEYRLFTEVLAQQIQQHKQLRMDLNYQIALGKGERLNDEEVFTWLSKKSGELVRLVENVNRIVNVALQEAFGPPGVPGDPEAIVYVTRRLGDFYRQSIQWALDFHHVVVEERFHRLFALASTLPSKMIEQIEEYSDKIKTIFDDVVADPPAAGEHRTLQLTLELDVPDLTEFFQQLKKLEEQFDES